MVLSRDFQTFKLMVAAVPQTPCHHDQKIFLPHSYYVADSHQETWLCWVGFEGFILAWIKVL
jgi:hypothetical protein